MQCCQLTGVGWWGCHASIDISPLWMKKHLPGLSASTPCGVCVLCGFHSQRKKSTHCQLKDDTAWLSNAHRENTHTTRIIFHIKTQASGHMVQCCSITTVISQTHRNITVPVMSPCYLSRFHFHSNKWFSHSYKNTLDSIPSQYPINLVLRCISVFVT